MSWFNNMKIAKKLAISFACVLILMALSGGFAIVQLKAVNGASSDMSRNWIPRLATLADLKLVLTRMRSNDAQLQLTDGDDEAGKKVNARTEDAIKVLNKTLATYETQIALPAEQAIYPTFKKNVETLLQHHKMIAEAMQAHTLDEAKRVFRGDGQANYFKLTADLEKLVKINEEGAERANRGADDTFADARLGIILILALAMLAGIALAAYVARSISRPLRQAVVAARAVAGGDLRTDIRANSRDETGELMDALKLMNDALHGIVAQVRSGTDTIATASGQITHGNLDLSSRTEEQAGSLEETASAMEQMTGTVKQNSDNARQANALAATASRVAVEGGDVVSQVVDTMSSINESSRKIVDIISVIDGIAFQTNILALNAAVEAARAGEQGRGFAVVASEVRSLAQRSATAAKEIKQLIDDSVAKVEVGGTLVNRAGATMREVVDAVRSVTDIVAEISAASQEQSTGIEEINRAIMQMDQSTQENAALVEEAAAAAQSLQDQAQQLSGLVSVFKLSAAHVQAPTLASASAASGADPVRLKAAAKTASTTVSTTVPKAALPAARRALPAAGAQATSDVEWETF
ncbi:MCP four helix bundle domain-containing protein [Herbaspirillum sp. LeCh32-8]|uniref:methyl-accepting chemotaxis protein n=1 Tax=Herbaspirillum sp. LeCh32-8 TaxID=2821356 RepID=UPI001AE32B56|nr:methyl-accepting chemotaxis protein [Herbaspirillum sp. LeCh32-8]MBP0599819.1 MCP four helix bundle domain-containing protein [Herbaspirillum sp. LeCh32-8]